jgi:hypothetical protein
MWKEFRGMQPSTFVINPIYMLCGTKLLFFFIQSMIKVFLLVCQSAIIKIHFAQLLAFTKKELF